MKNNYLLLCVALMIPFFGMAQLSKYGCGTVQTPEMDAQLDAFVNYYYHNGGKYLKSTPTTKYVSTTIHLVADTDGTGNIQVFKALDLMEEMNEQYTATGADIQFCLREFNRTIKNSNWNSGSGTYTSTMPQIYKGTYGGNAALHMFLLGNANTSELCGVYIGNATQGGAGGSPDCAFISAGCFFNNSITWGHEFGHYLSLPHTFSGWEGEPNYTSTTGNAPSWAERADGSNCTTAGDKLCDTGADYLGYRWNCNGNSQSPFLLKDATGASFRADGTNTMAYSNDACSGTFTDDQIAAMHFNLQTYRSTAYTETMDWGDITETPNLVSPIDDGFAVTYDRVVLDWDAVDNATDYVVQVSRFQTFAAFLEETIVTGATQLEVNNLDPDRTYYWRVRAINKGDFGPANTSERYSFTTSDWAVGVERVQDVEAFTIQPNPVSNGEFVTISVDVANGFDGKINVYSVTGRLVNTIDYQFTTGRNTQEINTTTMGAGVYFVSIETAKGVVNKKLVITH